MKNDKYYDAVCVNHAIYLHDKVFTPESLCELIFSVTNVTVPLNHYLRMTNVSQLKT